MISIITAAYNAENHIENMIMSVASQPENVQLIVVNDGSKDRTAEICQECQSKYGVFDYYEIDNHGAGYARNYGIHRAKGDWIIFLDSDDLLIDGSICRELIAALKQYKKDSADIIYSCKAKTDFYLEGQPTITYPEKKVLFHRPRMEFWTCIYNRKFLIKNNICFFEYQEQDIESAFRYRAFSKASRIINKDDLCFYLQRDNPTSNMHTFNPIKLYRIKAMVYDTLLKETEFEADKGLLKTEIQNAVFRYFSKILSGGGITETEENVSKMLYFLKNIDRLDPTQLGKLGARKFYRYFQSYINCKKISRKVKNKEITATTAFVSKSEPYKFETINMQDFIRRWKRVSEGVTAEVAKNEQ